MTVELKETKMLRIRKVVMNFLLQTNAANEVAAKAYNDVVNFSQSSAMPSEIYSRVLWKKALGCGTVFSDRLLKSVFTEKLLPGTLAETPSVLFP